MRHVAGASLVLALAASAAAPAHAGVGELDPSFAAGGQLVLRGTGPGVDGRVLRRGRILVAAEGGVRLVRTSGRVERRYGRRGRAPGTAPGMFVARADGGALTATVTAEALVVRLLRPDGRVDRRYGTRGHTRLALADIGTPLGLLRARGHAAYVLTAAGDVAVLRRLSRTGRVDSAFGVRPVALPDGRALTGVRVAATLPDGRLVLAGSPGGAPADARLVRLLPDGTPDITFGDGGATVLPFAPSVIGEQRGAGIVHIAGVSEAGEGLAARISTDGVVDASYRAGGTEPLWRDGARATDAIVDAAGRLIVARAGRLPGSGIAGLPALVRLDETGIPDRRFGRDGTLALPRSGEAATVARVVLAPNSRLVAIGSVLRSGVPAGASVWRVDA